MNNAKITFYTHASGRIIQMLIAYRALLVLATLMLFSSCGSRPTKPETNTAPPNASATSSATMSPEAQQDYFDALTYINNNTPDKALKTLKELHFAYPQHPYIALNLATVYAGTKQAKHAKKLVEQLQASGHQSAGLSNLLGQLAMEAHDFKAAEAAFKQAIKQDKTYAPPFHNLARLHDIFYQDIAQAYDYYKRYLALQPNDESVAQWVEELKYSLE